MGSGVRSVFWSRVELTAGRLVGRVGGTSGSGSTSDPGFHMDPPTRPASSGSAGAKGALEGTAGWRTSAGGGPPASRSAPLPASPRPSELRLARKSGGSPDDTERLAATAATAAAPGAQGGGAAQSRGGFRDTGSSSESSGGSAGSSPTSSAQGCGSPSGPGSAAPVGAPADDAAAPVGAPADDPPADDVSAADRACAASRRAQAWNVGQTGNALERQYASWWASARADGRTSA